MGISGVSSELLQPLLSDTSVSESPSLEQGPLTQDHISDVQTRGRQVIGQQPLSSLGPSVSTQTKIMGQVLDKWASTAPAGKNMPKTVGITMPPGGHAMRLDGAMVEDEIASLPESERSEAVKNMPRVLQDRVNHGFELYTGIMTGDITGPASTSDVRDLMTFLTAKGMEKSDGFSEGAFSIQDPGHQLRNYLDTCTEVYQRPSSHISKFTEAPGGTHRGIDIDGDVKLPFGKATVLYGAMNDGVEGMKGDRLFIKMESHGCRLSSGSLGDKRDATGPADRPMRFFRDLKQTLGHACGFFKTLMRKVSGGKWFANSPDSRKERLPSDIKKEYKALEKHFKDSGNELMKGVLDLDNPTSDSRGVRTMVDNLRSALQDPALQGDDRAAVQDLLDKLNTRYDHLDVRVGDEMILDMDELGAGSTQKSVQGQMRAAINSLLGVDGPDELTDTHVEKFSDQLSKIGLMLERAGGMDDANRIIDETLRGATENLSQGQKDKLATLLGSDKCKGVMSGFLDVYASGGESLTGLRPSAKASAQRVSRVMLDVFSSLSKVANGGTQPDFDTASPADLAKAKQILTRAGLDSSVDGIMSRMMEKESYEQELSEKRSGEGLLSAKRGRLPDGVMVVGDIAKGLVKGEVDKEGIGRRLLGFLQHDLKNPDRPDLGGLPRAFVMDLLRDGVTVNGAKFGKLGGNASPKEKLDEVNRFIDAMGGKAKAMHVCTLANQNLMGDMMMAVQQDEALGPVDSMLNLHQADYSSQSRGISIDIDGENVSVKYEYSDHRTSSEYHDYERGINYSIGFTVQGAGSGDPVVRLDSWDVLYGTNPAQ